MFTTEDYLYGWLLYILGGSVFFACWWYLTRKIKTIEIRAILRVGCLVVMFTPWYASPDMDYLAPAVIIAAIEGIFDGNFWRAGAPLLTALAIGIAAALIYSITRRLAWRRSGEGEPENAPVPADH